MSKKPDPKVLAARSAIHRQREALIDEHLSGVNRWAELVETATQIYRVGGEKMTDLDLWVQMAHISKRTCDTTVSTSFPPGTVELNLPEGSVVLSYRDAVMFLGGYALAVRPGPVDWSRYR